MHLSSLSIGWLFAAATLAACSAPPAPAPATPTAAPAPVETAKPAPAPIAEAPAPCEAGTHAEEGKGCVADAPPPPPPCPDGMVRVAGGGPFRFGVPKRDVTVSDFCIDRTEVTASQYGACVKGGACSADHLDCAAAATYGAAGREDHPIVCVDFAQATAYCAAQNKRLPSDAEWEWAARGGAEGRTFPWGEEAPKEQLCWSGLKPLTGTCAVGSFAAGDNPEGIHDLAGNVFEWTTSENDKRSPLRVGRGGSWRDGVAEQVRAARPAGFGTTYRCGFLGIRCVTEPRTSP